MNQQTLNKGLILFDGYCNLCSGTVQFIIKRDKKDYFRFASLQSEIGIQILSEFQLPLNFDKSVILIEDKTVWLKSNAILRIVARLNGLWPVIGIMRILPQYVSDMFYDLIARYRFKLFGKKNLCFIPETKIQNKFIS